MNFPLILLVLTVVTGLFWLGDVFVWKKKRVEAEKAALAAFDAEHAGEDLNDPVLADKRKVAGYLALRRPAWLDWTAGLFPVILLVFVVRSFVVEPFRIPSGSMLPTLESGDFIAVNKYEYGIRFPVINKKITEGSKPKAGDVIVFDHPLNPGTDLIKRIVGLPGDHVSYRGKKLFINGTEQPQAGSGDYIDRELMLTYEEKTETLAGVEHRILLDSRAPDATSPLSPATTHPGAIEYTDEGFETTVPEGHYFVMGDNRDNSDDGRYWGFVPEENIVGRAFFIWLNIPRISRVGSFH